MVKKKPKKSLTEKIAEKEVKHWLTDGPRGRPIDRNFECKLQLQRQEELEAKERERQENLTPEDELAEKLRLQKIQEEADLKVAMDTFGVSERSGPGIEGMNPTNKAELGEFSEAISKKIGQFKHLEPFPEFLEELIRTVCANCKCFILMPLLLLSFMQIQIHSNRFTLLFYSKFHWTAKN